MKSILLTTTALVAFAGAAAADGHAGVSFSGSAVLGYNNFEIAVDPAEDNLGFYADMNLDVSMVAALDNGITVTASADVDELDASEGAGFNGVTLTVASEMATMTAGDTTFASEDYATAVGSMDADAGKAEQDGELVLKAAVSMGDMDAAVSWTLDNNSALTDNTGYGNMSAGASATFGTVSAAFTYQSGDAGTYGGAAQKEMMGFKASTTVAGLDVAAGYFTNTTDDKQSLGVSASYAIGEITLAGSYVNETVAGASGDANWDVSAAYDNGTLTAKAFTDESSDWGVEGTYALGNGIALAAGMVDAGDDIYIGGTYDLGGGATLLVSYADDKDADEAAADNDIGAAGYQVGTTVEVSFKF